MKITTQQRRDLLVRLIAISSRRLEKNGNFSLYPADEKLANLWKETCQKLQYDANAPIKFEREDKITFPNNEAGRIAGYYFLKAYHNARLAGIENEPVKEVMKEREKQIKGLSIGHSVAAIIKACIRHNNKVR